MSCWKVTLEGTFDGLGNRAVDMFSVSASAEVSNSKIEGPERNRRVDNAAKVLLELRVLSIEAIDLFQ